MKARGFTLIELLVVIAIIGILASIVLSSLSGAHAHARDAKRVSDLRNLQNALELYQVTNGSYPSTSGNWWGNCSGYGSHGITGANGWIPNLAPTFISSLPLDPKPIPTGYCYLYKSNGVDYMLLAHQTVETYTSTNNQWKRPAYPTQLSFAFYTSGASSW